MRFSAWFDAERESDDDPWHGPRDVAANVTRSVLILPQFMNDNYIRNRTGKIIGKEDGNYLRDGTGKIVARHDKSDDFTRDRTGKIAGKGDQRLRLLGR